MKHQFFIFSPLMAALLTGCLGGTDTQPPAPVYGNQTGGREANDEPGVNTKALEGYDVPITMEPIQEDEPYEKYSTERDNISNSPAVIALMSRADASSKTGDLETAVATVERALRIEPRNPHLVYKLATLRLQQDKPGLAEDLAKKAALLAGTDTKLKKSCWLLIADARERLGDDHGVAEAKKRAAKY